MEAIVLDKYVEDRKTHKEFMKFINLPENEDKTFELTDGYITMMAGNATGTHHRICAFIIREIGNYLKGKKCEVFQDINVHLFKENIGECQNVFQPDVMVGCDRDNVTDRGYEGAPEFIVEVVSKSSARRDYIEKLLYLKYGVREYWIVNPFQKNVIAYINEHDMEESPKVFTYSFEDVVPISVLNNFSIDFKEIKSIL